MIEGVFGSLIFGKVGGRIVTFEDLNRRYTARYGSHMVHMQKPLLEWAGSDLIKIDLTVRLNASWSGDPNLTLAQMHFYHENALAAPLIIGTKPMAPGLSLFVVTDLDESHKHWLRGGQLVAAEVRVSFLEYRPFVNQSSPLSALGIPGFGG